MKLFYVLLASTMAVRNIRLARAYPARRWFMAAFWICFGALAATRGSAQGSILLALFLLGLLLACYSRLPYLLVLAGPRLTANLTGLFFQRRVMATADTVRRMAVWLACSLRGRPLLIAYRRRSTLGNLVEAHLLPRVAGRAMILKDWSPQENHKFPLLERAAARSTGKLGRLPLLVRFHPVSAPRRFNPRKALWLAQHGSPEKLERLVSVALQARPSSRRSR